MAFTRNFGVNRPFSNRHDNSFVQIKSSQYPVIILVTSSHQLSTTTDSHDVISKEKDSSVRILFSVELRNLLHKEQSAVSTIH